MKYWTARNAMKVMAKMTKRAMIRPDDQAYFDPPHCMARSRQKIDPTNRGVPTRSSFMRFFRSGTLTCCGLAGICRKKKRRARDAPPKAGVLLAMIQ